jgi:hypothetical protein
MPSRASQLWSEYENLVHIWQTTKDEDYKGIVESMGADVLVEITKLPPREFRKLMNDLNRGTVS